ncbi:MAG: two-component regulator propeller domain-containing protein [Paludibacter sp.]|nr:two-component regulator propeller domain-containing protein [Paludibacter sp.]
MVKRILFIVCFFLTIFSFGAMSAPAGFSFERFTYNDKLPSNSVIRIFDDKEGYMWFGTKDGLCRFDGYDMKVFRSSALTPGKLSNNEIQCIAEDNDQQLWIGTFEGINIINKKSYSIRHFENEFVRKERINSILSDSKGYIWIGTSSNGVLHMNPKTGEFKRYTTDKNSPLKLKSNNISNIYEDHEGRIWISSWKSGLCYIDKNQTHVTNISKIGINDNPFRIYQDKDKMIWVCTWGDGIFNIDNVGKPNMLVHPIQLAKNSGSHLDAIVYSITQDDKFGYIWVVTFSGLSLIDKQADGTYKLIDTGTLFNETSNKLFHVINKDHRGNLWIGSVGDGLYKLDFNKPSIQNYPLNEIKTSLNVQSYVTRFCENNDGNVYIAINRIGLFLFNPKTGIVSRPLDAVAKSLGSISAIKHIKSTNEIWVANEGEDLIHIFKTDNSGTLKQTGILPLSKLSGERENTISNLFEDSKGNVWIGTNTGLYQKPINSVLKLISNQIYSVNAIGEDSEQNILVGTEKEGLFLLKTIARGEKTSYGISKMNLSIDTYQSLSVQTICCKKNGEVYIGTKEGCIYYYNKQNKTASDISGLYGITDEGILDILEDNYGFLWISTIKRIVRYNPETHAATYYSNNDGLLVSSFFKDARIKLKSGQIFFGGNKGISAFNPANLSTTIKPIKQHVAITDILIQNKSIFDDESNLHFDAEKNRVTLKYSENNLSIEFSALDYSSASKIQYAYKLSGVDNSWNYVGNNRRFVNYANLPEGKYEFNVKASDENGLWSDKITTLEVVIKPPLYRSWWAYLIYLGIMMAAGYFSTRTVANRIRLRNELKISHIEKEKSEELAQTKLRYFTNISHELLTPLTIIMLLIESLQHKNKEDSAQFEIMKDTVLRLKRLIQQILVFRKTETGNMKLKIVKNDIIAFVNNICQSNFRPLVTEKEINFSFDVEYDSYMAYFDPDKLDKIIYNLLSNAFKHTPRGGTIAVKMSLIPRNEETILRLSVSDTGDGIAEEDIPHIFKRFYISSSADQSQSHGIGLALTSDLLQLHKGKIEVKSQLNEGAVFTIEIPVSASAYTEEELSSDDLQVIDLPEIPDILDATSTFEMDEESDKIEDYSMLIVEDNKDLRNLISDHFARKYRVFSAENGLRALEIVSENEIDLIISDVMMPEMDGLTFCKKIKNDVATSHINMLMLTAKNSTEDRIDCYNAGADSYIAKPFELAVLNARVKNLIGKRLQKVDTFQHNQDINITSMEYNSIDEVFLQQAVKKVEEKLADETFDFDQFAIDMSTSKSTLHRKLKSLTGLSPGEFIRNIRLKHAAMMLTNNIGNVSEIAYSVGFNDPKYFSRCFKIEFGLTPKEYQEDQKNKK